MPRAAPHLTAERAKNFLGRVIAAAQTLTSGLRCVITKADKMKKPKGAYGKGWPEEKKGGFCVVERFPHYRGIIERWRIETAARPGRVPGPDEWYFENYWDAHAHLIKMRKKHGEA